MESRVIELSKYRFKRAQETLEDAKIHVLRSVTALDGFDSSKHSGIIAYINKRYVKEGIFDRQLSKILDRAFRLREKADYDDFIVVSAEMAEEQLIEAEAVINVVQLYLIEKWNNKVE